MGLCAGIQKPARNLWNGGSFDRGIEFDSLGYFRSRECDTERMTACFWW